MQASGLRHVHVEGMVTGIDFQDGLLEVHGPDSEYLNNILAFCKRRFTEFLVKTNVAADGESLSIRTMEQIYTADADIQEKCSIHFTNPVYAMFEYTDKENMLSVTFAKKPLAEERGNTLLSVPKGKKKAIIGESEE